MAKVYLFALMLLFVPLTGCIESDDPNDSMELEEAVNDFINAMSTGDFKKVCKYTGYEIDYEANKITLHNNTKFNECVQELTFGEAVYEYKITTSNYTEENREYRASSNSGFVYAVNVVIEECVRDDEFEPWDCEQFEEMFLWVEVNGQWIWYLGLDLGPVAPVVTFYSEKNSGGYWDVQVIKVSKEDDLTKFSFFLKDDSGSTYVGGNGFGEVAMQIVSGEEHGIETSYNGDDEQLERRAANVSNDDGTDYPVHFADNDRNGMLSAGDQFTVYGTGNSANGPAESGWKLDIQFDASGDIIGSAKLYSSDNAPIARITPSNPKIQINETISFSGSDSTDADGDELSFLWSFEGDTKHYEGANIERNYTDKGEYLVTLQVTDSTGLSDEIETTVSVVEDYHDEQSGNVNGNDTNIELPVDNGFISLGIEYSLESASINPLEESQVTLRLTDADGVVVQEENGVGEGDGAWSYSSDDLSSNGEYIFTIENESGSMDFYVIIDVKY